MTKKLMYFTSLLGRLDLQTRPWKLEVTSFFVLTQKQDKCAVLA